MSFVRPVTSETFNNCIADATTPVVVDFWSELCPPCKQVSEVLEELAEELGDRALFVSVDVAANTDLATKYSVSSVPTVVIFSGGQLVRTLVGGRPKRHIVRELEAYLAI